ncbi:MAG: helix-turn-helix domain-containing protein [Pseudomonadota bacterium]|uniref:AraC family transcriptional regulator n=1 Tax=Roseovarius TaxID=74030 RepID=UPI0022A801CA|nr:helix-turn-helix domain-containing protein [Roseovarius sp. EGI FJ00037]MCZ0810999.1 helix-turn-helix domain-containing protein [Roseovarius sp. EGI FJ00037]
MTLAQWSGPARWQSELPHSRENHAFVWITRGQGRCLLEGLRRGVGVHNALVIPAGTLFATDLGKQGFGLVCTIPPNTAVPMPDTAQQLRVRDAQPQAELATILESMQREDNARRHFHDEAMSAFAALLGVWLRRTMIDAPTPPRPPASERLVRAYAALIERDHASGKPMADYAAALGVTPTHLTRTCRAAAGMSAAQLLTQRIVHAARMLLEQSDRPFNLVAAMLGFRSAAYFSRFVLHHTGETPTQLRRKASATAPPTPASHTSTFRGVG